MVGEGSSPKRINPISDPTAGKRKGRGIGIEAGLRKIFETFRQETIREKKAGVRKTGSGGPERFDPPRLRKSVRRGMEKEKKSRVVLRKKEIEDQGQSTPSLEGTRLEEMRGTVMRHYTISGTKSGRVRSKKTLSRIAPTIDGRI